jgi:hypothetical protein
MRYAFLSQPGKHRVSASMLYEGIEIMTHFGGGIKEKLHINSPEAPVYSNL